MSVATVATDRWERAWTFLKSQPVYWREAALCAPAMPLLLIGGLATGRVLPAAVATGAAFCVGFGAARDFRRWRWGAMLAATAGTTATAFIGCLAGQQLATLLVAAAIAAAACAVTALMDEDLWWISLQMVIALVIAGAYSGPFPAALARSQAVLAGGVVQMLVVVPLATLAPSAAQRLPAGPPKPPSPVKLYISHAARAAVCVCASLWLARRLGLGNGYWAPMTAMIVLKPGLSDTVVRGLARVTGTLIGCIVATIYASAVGYAAPWLIAAVAFCATSAFALQKSHYAILTSAVTATVVLLISLATKHAALNAEHRLLATLLGGGMALVVARIAPHRPPEAQPAFDQVGGA